METNEISSREVVLKLPGMDEVGVRPDIAYAPDQGAALTMDVYSPRAVTGAQPPAVVLVTGYPDSGARSVFGCSLKQMAQYVGWARLVACCGMAAITYESVDPVRDARLLLDHLHETGDRLGIDASRVGLWSCSGNVPNALALLAERADLRCAALCYGYMADQEGHDEVAQAAARFGFAVPDPCPDLAKLVGPAVLVARAGLDEIAGLNESLDRFAGAALAANLELTLLNYACGAHAFDIFDDSPGSRAAIRQILAFLQARLL